GPASETLPESGHPRVFRAPTLRATRKQTAFASVKAGVLPLTLRLARRHLVLRHRISMWRGYSRVQPGLQQSCVYPLGVLAEYEPVLHQVVDRVHHGSAIHGERGVTLLDRWPRIACGN